jgi:hypothetical protein
MGLVPVCVLLALWLLPAHVYAQKTRVVQTQEQLLDALRDAGTSRVELGAPLLQLVGPASEAPLELDRDLLITSKSPQNVLDLAHGSGGLVAVRCAWKRERHAACASDDAGV